jgi:hypothetical protein
VKKAISPDFKPPPSIRASIVATAPQRQDNEQKNQWDREAAQPDAGILGSVRRWFWTKKKAVNRVVSIAAQ